MHYINWVPLSSGFWLGLGKVRHQQEIRIYILSASCLLGQDFVRSAFFSQGLEFLTGGSHLQPAVLLAFQWLTPPASSHLAATCDPLLQQWEPSPNPISSP